MPRKNMVIKVETEPDIEETETEVDAERKGPQEIAEMEETKTEIKPSRILTEKELKRLKELEKPHFKKRK